MFAEFSSQKREVSQRADQRQNSKTPARCLRDRVALTRKDRSQRVQYSVFECILDPAQWAYMKQRLIDLIDKEVDSLRFYYLGSNWRRRIEHVGAKKTLDQERPVVV